MQNKSARGKYWRWFKTKNQPANIKNAKDWRKALVDCLTNDWNIKIVIDSEVEVNWFDRENQTPEQPLQIFFTLKIQFYQTRRSKNESCQS